jgi:hypothetical protein
MEALVPAEALSPDRLVEGVGSFPLTALAAALGRLLLAPLPMIAPIEFLLTPLMLDPLGFLLIEP